RPSGRTRDARRRAGAATHHHRDRGARRRRDAAGRAQLNAVIRLLICAVMALQNDRWTLDRLVDEALRANPQVTQSEAALESSRQQLSEAARAWWPSFSVEDSQTPAPDIRCNLGAGVEPILCAGGSVHNIQQTGPDGFATRLELRMAWLFYGLGPLKD